MLNLPEESLTHMNFLRLVQEVLASPEFMTLSPTEERLLNLLASSWALDQKITVLKVVQVDPRISHSISHRLLKSLRLKKFIRLCIDETDNRVKYVQPTDKTLDFFKALGLSVERANEGIPA
ncbi:MAG: hypothetical protein QMB14_11340 [Polaromonas sp.]